MVYDAFMLSIYFDSIEKMKVGDELKITLADKGDDHVILHFRNVSFSCSFGDYLTDGYLYCPLYDTPTAE